MMTNPNVVSQPSDKFRSASQPGGLSANKLASNRAVYGPSMDIDKSPYNSRVV
jgi:hypothetical protein